MVCHDLLKKAATIAGCVSYLAGVVSLAHHLLTHWNAGWAVVAVPASVAVAAVAGWAFHQAGK
ncbi:hypothetical protein A3H22_00030 [Candidatus Peribacteria bacterium RIFCSPLOWO2_12_FULL_55_15]|nr:MAG: hypothetical protein A2789_01415 [Candidatus Peribacteria bacterium RIFCSPHIGHO2_01_FULL_54_22]OGJ63084.1 MAG: hypothetical protein A3D12_02580 [Candidatus Peribacteria bacterium RIFCSPHIGHO2_02_FULL_55_24]OGJ63960.1 MAG: hypothetical protein A3E47_00540 [Candidatus Peribacteria bacterium RIFCSPHIGHO2_12_FULL_54_10]OGJ68128.1 MAG: hypothetical protein A2947_03085 [Candidatus Peribacteria bacterium RIFCSPLOWO2_01_FULL_54_110]OGJ70148.1 MAG: hypothetical protein A3H90_00380 [Candidatus Pe